MTRALKTAPWQLWVVDFGIPAGHEQGGVRPVIVVGSHGHCSLAIDLMLVVPLTTRDRGLRHHVRIASASSGLHHPSWARTEELRAIATARLPKSAPIGVASAEEIEELRKWLRAMVAFLRRGGSGVLSAPGDLDEGALARALEQGWSTGVAAMTYRPVGWGSHHWEVTGAEGMRWFVTVTAPSSTPIRL